MNFLNLFKKTVNTVVAGTFDTRFDDIVEDTYREFKRQDAYFYGLKPGESKNFTERLLPCSDKEKVAFVTDAVKKIAGYNKNRRSWTSDDVSYSYCVIRDAFMRQLLRSKLTLEDSDLLTILQTFLQYPRFDHSANILHWPVSSLVAQVEKQLKDRAPSPELVEALKEVRTLLDGNVQNWDAKERRKIAERISTIIFNYESPGAAVREVWFAGDDEFASYANASLASLKPEDRNQWFRLMQLSGKASGGTPSKKYLDEAKALFSELGADKFKKLLNDWMVFLSNLKEKITEHPYTHNGRDLSYTTQEFLSPPTVDTIKGFVWMCVHFHDKTTLNNIAALAERAYRKIPGKGPAAMSIGNACLYVLAHSKGLDGIGHLSRLRLRIRQNTTQNLIEKYINGAAAQQGVSIHEIEDMAVDDYGLENGSRTWEFDDYKAVLSITGIGKTTLNWFKPDGSPQKSVPAFVKEKHKAKLKKIRDTIKQIELTTTAQRDRVDRMFKSTRTLSWQQFNEFYFAHGLMGFLTQKLVWTFDNVSKKESAIYIDGAWTTPWGHLSFVPGDDTNVSLWHPATSSVQEIQAWREALLERNVSQPLKQVFREVYLLTDAEVVTRTYSNRMAAHLLKQHQFNSLAKVRGWKYSLLGAYDDGRYNEAASVNLPEYGLRAEFWVAEVNAENAFNDTGIWLYVATDQVRFVKADTNEVVELVKVPPLAFTEVMRDVDLFVGVASVGNDPAWRDTGGLVQYRDYWQSYSFGDLNEVAKTRKVLLERLVPRLKIARVAEVRDKFLVVKGKLRTYKIHIGSTNILMEPNDQYLCIVPDRSARNVSENLFLPFEGDNGVSVILSKAMLLADDDKITDSTITSQINRK